MQSFQNYKQYNEYITPDDVKINKAYKLPDGYGNINPVS